MKRLAILAGLALVLAGCGTPQARYDTDNFAWLNLKTTALLYEAYGKPTPAITAIIKANEATGDENLAAAADWLKANPVLAQTPHYDGPPTLSNFNVFFSALQSSLSAFVPATQP